MKYKYKYNYTRCPPAASGEFLHLVLPIQLLLVWPPTPSQHQPGGEKDVDNDGKDDGGDGRVS